ncbi:MAG: hypothetical protein HZC47_01870 [Methanobacterium sp.]|uniref:hypothetical protein n=1 Tax=Methanobacterium sp. TaxID=2164 RepID=UPI003D649BE8|nr:hypothetical protein [Methanobacterium sp.]
MIIKEWDIWNSNLTYFIYEIKNLENIAESLVDNELCTLVCHSNGNVWWKDENRVESGIIKTEKKEYRKSDINIPKKLKKSEYLSNNANIAALMRFDELIIFKKEYLDSFSYIRGYINSCYMEKDGKTIVLYPQIKLYNNGVMEVSFRIELLKSENEPPKYEIDDFIEKLVNIVEQKVDRIGVPQKLAILEAKFRLEPTIKDKWKIWDFRFKNSIDEENQLIFKNTEKVEERDLIYPMTYLDDISKYDFYIKNLDIITRFIISSVEYIIKKTENKHNYTNLKWINRPSVYITDFEDLTNSSIETIEKYKVDIAKILARNTYGNFKDLNIILGDDLRFYKDYNFFVSYGLSLVVYSKIKQDEVMKDNPTNRFIFEKQVQIESINYLYMCHKRIAEKSSLLSIPYEPVLEGMLNVLKLDSMTKGVTKFLELNNTYSFVDKILKWDEERKYANEMLDIRAKITNERKNEDFKVLGLMVTVIFGLIGASTFVSNVTIPIWKHFNLWLPATGEISTGINQVFLFVITAVLIIILIFSLFLVIKRFRKEIKIT